MLSRQPIYRFFHSATTAVITSINTPSSIPNPIHSPNPLEQPALVKLKAERDPERLFLLFKANANNRLVIENRFAFEDTVSRLAGARCFDYIEHLLEHQKTLPQGRREGFIVRIIMLYGKAGMTKHAMDTFQNMHLYGCPRTVKSFNAALKVLAQTRDLVSIAEFANKLPGFDIDLDIFSVNIFVKAYCDMDIPDKAYIFMLEMKNDGIRPDVVTYTTLMSAFYKKNRWVIGNGLWNLMVLRGCCPNLATFNVRIQYLANKRRPWEANRLVNSMKDYGILPDEVTYNLMLKGFFLAGFSEMAKMVYSSLNHRGCKMNVKIYQTMIHYLCRGGDFDSAYNVCKSSMKENWFPSIESVNVLVEGLKRNGQYHKAKFIVILAQRRKPPFSSNKMVALRNLLHKK